MCDVVSCVFGMVNKIKLRSEFHWRNMKLFGGWWSAKLHRWLCSFQKLVDSARRHEQKRSLSIFNLALHKSAKL